LAERIQKTISEQFEIDLQVEPIIFNAWWPKIEYLLPRRLSAQDNPR
jgi:hypothetical protein